MKSKTSDENDV